MIIFQLIVNIILSQIYSSYPKQKKPRMWGSSLNLNSTPSVGSQYLIQMIPAGADQKKNEKIA